MPQTLLPPAAATDTQAKEGTQARPKVFIRNFGCQMNEYDGARLGDLLRLPQSGGYELTEDWRQADLLMLNTCAIREKAEEKLYSELGRLRAERKPGALIGICGCMATSQEGKALLARAPFVDVVAGPQTLHRLPALIAARQQAGRAQSDISFPRMEKFDLLPPPGLRGVSAFVSIMEGCSRFCSYCVVPMTRGPERSRSAQSILTEITLLAEQGAREVTLLGQNVNAWRGETPEGERGDLAWLIRAVARIEPILRIRFITSHPRRFAPSLIAAFAEVEKLAAHLHLPPQHGSNRILEAMQRGYRVEEYLQTVSALRQARPDITLSGDFIVGFPGETDADFQSTLDLVESAQFDASFSFLFSPRPGTPAAALPDETPMALKRERLARLQAKLDAQEQHFARARLGTLQGVLVTGTAARDSRELTGKTPCNRSVNFPAPSDEQQPWIGQMASVRITEALRHSLRGEYQSP